MKVDGRSERATQHRAERRAHILASAIRVFAERGYHHTSITDIVDAAGVARGTFYLYFESKSAVFMVLLDELFLHLREHVSGVSTDADAKPIEEQLFGIVRLVLQTILHNRALATILFREAVGLDLEVDARLRLFYTELLGYLKETLEEGQRLQIVRPLDAEAVSVCVLGSVKQIIEQFLLGDANREFDLDRYARTVIDYNLRGIMMRYGN